MANQIVNKYRNTVWGSYIKGPVNKPITYIPKINLTDLARNPEAYVKRKMRIIQRIVTWRTKQAALRIVNQALNPKNEKLEMNQKNPYASSGYIEVLRENHDEIMQGRHFYGLDKRNEIYEFLILQVQTENGRKVEFIDKHAIISVQRAKNLIMTQVLGRDLTRKELFGKGDYTIRVSGKIVSQYRDVYPTADVQDFLEIMNTNDVVLCYSPFLFGFGISSMVIRNFHLQQQVGTRNIQNYTFEAVFEKSIDEMQIEENETKRINEKAIQETKGWLQIAKETFGKVFTKETLTEVLNPKSVLQQSKWI